MIRRKLGNTKMATTTINPTDIKTAGEIVIGDTTTPIVKAGGVDIITTTDLQSSPVITQSEVLTQQEMMLPDSSRPTSEISNISDSATLTQDEQLQTTEPPKKQFPWWILLVGAGLIYMLARKK
jgi:hypothetical protein